MKFKYYYNISLLILIIVVIFQFEKSFVLIKNIQSLSKQNHKLASQLYEFDGKGQLLNPLVYYYNLIRLKTNKHNPTKKPFLLVLFDNHSCPELLLIF